MGWDYWTWIACSVSISGGIVLLTVVVLLVLLLKYDTIFYGVVNQLLNIERCFIDAHHRIVRKDEQGISFDDTVQKYLASVTSKFDSAVEEPAHAFHNIAISTPIRVFMAGEQPSATAQNSGAGTSDNASEINTDHANKTSIERQEEVFPESKSSPEHVREVLNVYGRYMSVRKKRTRVFLMTLIALIISGGVIAAFNSIFLATTTVYRGGPCPPIGPMECFCGNNYTNFSCDTGKTTACPFDVSSSVCFRWVARDLTTSDLTTALGVTTGLLIAFGNIAQALIRIYLLAYNKRLGIAIGIYRIAAKTIGINRDTARTRCCCCSLPWHCSACNLKLFKHPAAVIIATVIYIAIPLLMIPAVILLYQYQLSVTALTFIVLIILAMFCGLSIVWIMVEETESSSNVPGGWTDVKNLIGTTYPNGTQIAKGKTETAKSHENR